MIKHKTYTGPVRPAHWQVLPTFQLSPRRILERGSWFRVEGIREQFEFIAHVINPDKPAEWVDAFDAAGRYRAFRPARVTRMVKRAN